MPNEKKLTLNVGIEMHSRLEEIGGELGITTTELLRRAIGLVSVPHTLIQERADDVFICSKDEDGNLQQQHVLSNLLY